MLISPLQPLILWLVDKAIGTGDSIKKMGEVPADPGEKRANTIITTLQYGLFLLSIFLPLKVRTPGFYLGLIIYLFGVTLLLIAMTNVAMTPYGQLIRHGTYRYSRHPLYFSLFLIFIGVGLASASIIFLMLTIIFIGLMSRQVRVEERECLSVFGTEYSNYMHSTRRWLGIPKS